MKERFFKTLSISVSALLVAAVSSADAQGRSLDVASTPVTSAQVGCSAQHEIDLGWEYQLGLLEARLQAKESATLDVKGAIISPPFKSRPTLGPPEPSTAARATESGVSGTIDHESSKNRF
jgi:hypothetical protein